MPDTIPEAPNEIMSDIKITQLSIKPDYFVDKTDTKNKTALLIQGVIARAQYLQTKRDWEVDVLSLKPNESSVQNNPYISSGRIDRPTKTISNLVLPPKNTDTDAQQDEIFGMMAKVDTTGKSNRFLDTVNDKDKFLIVTAHGGGKNSFVIGEGYNANISPETLLSNLQNLIDVTGQKVNDYACVILETCNEFSHPIPQEVVNKLGVPVIYVTGLAKTADLIEGKSQTNIITPSSS